ncbi:MAG: energy transducer TonB [Bacteroidaceae bacterium]|nr:energy transducer TonB [Bacteroidaceae bacterium]
MEALTTYAIKAAICLTVLYLPYTFMLRRHTFFSFNRIVLLSIVAMSFVFPLLDIPLLSGLFTPTSAESPTFIDIGLPLTTQVEAERSTNHISWMRIITLVYVIGASICLRRKCVGLIKLIRFIPQRCMFTDKKDGITAQNYQYLLISKTVDNGYFPFANSFNHSLLKKRIKMMKTKKSNPWNRMKVLYVLPVSCLVLSAFATPTTVETPDNVVSSAKDVKDVTFDVCEVMPEYKGGMTALMKYLTQSVKYPESAQKEKIEGRVIVTFVVDKDGSICEAKVVSSVSPDIDAEAVRVVNSMPKWRPGRQNGEVVRVRYTLPITFRLTGGENKVATKDESGPSIRNQADY